MYIQSNDFKVNQSMKSLKDQQFIYFEMSNKSEILNLTYIKVFVTFPSSSILLFCTGSSDPFFRNNLLYHKMALQ